MKESPRIIELDALRGVAAIGVVLWHYSGHFNSKPLAAVFGPFYANGLYLVDFFFVLSGFVLSKAYFRDSRRYRLMENIVRRSARIYPLHLFTLGLVFIGQLILVGFLRKPSFIYRYNDFYHFILNLALTQSLGIQKGFSFNGPSWSVSTEFYVSILFFIILATSKKPTKALIGLLIFSMGLFSALISSGHIRFIDPSIFRTLLGFLVGVILFKFFSYIRRFKTWLYDVAFFFILSLLIIAATSNSMKFNYSEFVLVILGFPLLIFSVLNGLVVPRVLRFKLFSFFGDISFSLYLIHFPVQLYFHIAKAVGFASVNYEKPITLIVFAIITIGLASLCYFLLELPAQNLINDWWAERGKNVWMPNNNFSERG
ncbi:MAG: acyltransferase family protein [Eubacteriales bacterium]